MITRETIKNKEYKEYDRVSRYSVFPFYYVVEDNKYVYGITSHLKHDNVKYITHKVVRGDTLDSIALYYYNNPTYFWIVADFNGKKTIKPSNKDVNPSFANCSESSNS